MYLSNGDHLVDLYSAVAVAGRNQQISFLPEFYLASDARKRANCPSVRSQAYRASTLLP
jgi:hypothetical protein